jgi:hypothetical protein
MLWPDFELAESREEKTHLKCVSRVRTERGVYCGTYKSALPVSKSRFKFWPPTDVVTRYSTPLDGTAVADPSCRFSNSLRKEWGISFVGFKLCFAYAFNMAAVPLRWKLALCTAGAENVVLPTRLTAGAGAA